MARFFVNHSWEDYRKTLEYVGFKTQKERSIISIGDSIVYFGKGLVAGIFEAQFFVEGGFSGWQEQKAFQIKLKPVLIPKNDLIARPLHYKVQLERPVENSSSVYRLSGQEFSKISLALSEKKKELVF